MKILATALVLLAAPLASLPAQQMDMEMRMKWALAELVHYDVVAEYSAPTSTLIDGGYKTAVKDRFELSFDYAPTKVSVVGKPAFKNVASTVSNVYEGVCRQPEVNGPYEHLEVLDTKPAMGTVDLTIKRTFPAGGTPFVNEEGKCGLRPAAARVETVTHSIPVIPGTFFATPSLAPKHVRIGEKASETNTVTIGKDEKTIVVDDSAVNGWKYTYTLKIAK